MTYLLVGRYNATPGHHYHASLIDRKHIFNYFSIDEPGFHTPKVDSLILETVSNTYIWKTCFFCNERDGMLYLTGLTSDVKYFLIGVFSRLSL